MPKTVKVTGGDKYRKFMREAKRALGSPTVIEVGFKERRIAVLAAQLEFGNPKTKLPERPAFRLGIDSIAKVVGKRIAEMKREDLRAKRGAVFGLTRDQAVEIAILARDTLRQAYHDFHGAPLSERQKARKAGTQYADEQLVGAEGPRLISHIRAYVNDAEVG